VTLSDEGHAIDSIRDIERRQDEVLRELDLLEQRIAALLSEYAGNAAPTKKAA
jgi:hypothetical protein